MKKTVAGVQPQNLEAEQCVLGAMVLSKEAVVQVATFLKPEHFYSQKHAVIYENIVIMESEKEPVDLVSLTERFRRARKLEEIGGVAYITKIMRSVPSAAHVLNYAKMVHEKAVLRNLLKAASKIQGMVYQGTDDCSTVLDMAEQLVFTVAQKQATSEISNIKDLIHDSFDLIEEMYKRKEKITGVETGFTKLDMMTSGFQNSDLIILAARPSVGKTSLALNIAANVAMGVGQSKSKPVLIFSVEMTSAQLVQRMLCSEGRISLNRLRTGYLGQADWAGLTEAAGSLSDAPIFIDDSPELGLMEIRSRARRMKAQHDIALVIVDYLQIMRINKELENRVQEVSYMSRKLKSLARELDIPVLTLSQLSREQEKRGGEPRLSDLRGSGSIEQDADLVMFLHKVDKDEEESVKRSVYKLIVGKHRNGPTGPVELYFNKEYMRFGNLARVEPAPF